MSYFNNNNSLQGGGSGGSADLTNYYNKTQTQQKINEAVDPVRSQLDEKANLSDVAKISSGTPLFASSVSGMTNTTRNYVNTSDGYLYGYIGGNWINSNIKYQEMGISNGQVTPSKTSFIETIDIADYISQIDDINGKTWSNGLVNTGGTISNSNEWQTVGIIPIYERRNYRIEGLGVTVQVVYFTDLKNDGVPVTVGWISSSVGYADITIPDGKTFMAINVNSITKTVKLKRKFQLDTEKEFKMPKLKIDNFNQKPLEGKTIINFGDSIFGQTRPPYDISTKLADISGATVYNCGFGGCQMGMHSEVKWDAFSMYRLADSISTNSWTVQENALSLGGHPDYFRETVNLLKTIDFSKVDIITIAYGTNDFTNGLQPVEAGSGQFKAVATSLQYSIEKILSVYKNIRIFIIPPVYRVWLNSDNTFNYDSNTATHTPWVSEADGSNGKPHTFLELIQGIKDIAKNNQLTTIDNYNIGINKFNWLQYFPSNDGVHHNQNGRDLIATSIANKLY